MTPKRTIVVIAAVALGVVAALLSYSYLNNAQQVAYHNAKLVNTYVVAKAVPQTMTGDSALAGGYIEQKSLPTEIVPATAVTDINVIKGKEAASAYSVGQVVVDSMFVNPTVAVAQGSFSQSIPAGDVAVTISVDQVHGVAGLAVPGDKVDLLISQTNASATTESSLLQNVPILAIGQQSASPATNTASAQTTSTATVGASSGLFTFGVSPSDAARIALAQQESLGIYLLLVPPSNPVVSIPAWGTDNILTGPQN
jgi:pilus assembly protein CpaB